jgi:hypothetical protein
MRASASDGTAIASWAIFGIQVMPGDEGIDHVEIALGHAVHGDDPAAGYRGLGFGIPGAVEGGKAVGRVFGGELVEPQRAFVPLGKAFPAIGHARRGGAILICHETGPPKAQASSTRWSAVKGKMRVQMTGWFREPVESGAI